MTIIRKNTFFINKILKYFTAKIAFLFRDRDHPVAVPVLSNTVPVLSNTVPVPFLGLLKRPTSLSVLSRS